MDDVAGTRDSRSSRQLAAADKIGRWADRYEADERGLADPAFGETKKSQRVARLVIAVVVALVVALQLLWIYSAVER